MSFDLLARIVAEAAPRGLTEIIPSTMGEPLLYDGFDGILDLCRAHGVRLNLTTNASFPRRSPMDWARALVPITSDVKFSWNGATAATQECIMRGSRFEEGLAGIRAFAAVRDAHAAAGGNRCRLTIQMTFLEANFQELPGIVDLAAELGVDRVKGHHLWVHFPETEGWSMRRSPAAIAAWNAVVEESRRVAVARGVLLENVHRLSDGAVEDLDPDAVCPFLDREAWVAWDGRFHPCCAPDVQRRALGDFGTLHERSLAEIWASEAYRTLVRDYRDHPLCRRCNMRRRA
jgi:MoaA/NifB/PqqE/SkfB family radical SAM enzyme